MANISAEITDTICSFRSISPPKICVDRIVFTSRTSLQSLAVILQGVQKIDAFKDYEISLARKTKGGVSVVHRITGEEYHIIQGVCEEWPYISDTSLSKVRNCKGANNFLIDGVCITSLSKCPDLRQDLEELADVILYQCGVVLASSE